MDVDVQARVQAETERAERESACVSMEMGCMRLRCSTNCGFRYDPPQDADFFLPSRHHPRRQDSARSKLKLVLNKPRRSNEKKKKPPERAPPQPPPKPPKPEHVVAFAKEMNQHVTRNSSTSTISPHSAQYALAQSPPKRPSKFVEGAKKKRWRFSLARRKVRKGLQRSESLINVKLGRPQWPGAQHHIPPRHKHKNCCKRCFPCFFKKKRWRIRRRG
mmetsp:Transcript_8735/g.26852  ORF Transcript_8735/g.26852 Transcript_8735/m.26852 type:complete len:218 (-) Transcript_8735:107-760(-)